MAAKQVSRNLVSYRKNSVFQARPRPHQGHSDCVDWLPAQRVIGLKWAEADTESSCLRLEDSKEGESIHPIGFLCPEHFAAIVTVGRQ